MARHNPKVKRKKKKPPTAAQTKRGRGSRRKGKKWEQQIARDFRKIGWHEAKRGWQSRSGRDAPDVENVEPFWIEAKHHKLPSPLAALQQAVEDSEGTGLIPVAIVKKDRQPPIAVMLYEDFLNVAKAAAPRIRQ